MKLVFRRASTLIAVTLLGIAAIAQDQPATEVAEPAPKENVEVPEGMQVLDIELPKPMFVGTPKNLRAANLEPLSDKSRPPFLVPADAVNLALDKEVSGSDEEPIIGWMEQLTDGDKEAVDGSFVEFGPGLQYVQIDLGAPSEISAIVVWHYHQQARVYHDVVVQTADDPDFITNVQTVFNNDHDNSAKLGVGKDRAYVETYEGRLIDVRNATGRYVRLYSNGNTSNEMNHYIEIEVYGKQ